MFASRNLKALLLLAAPLSLLPRERTRAVGAQPADARNDSGDAARARADASVSELRRLLAEGFRVRDLFYESGLHVILERQAGARVSPVQTSARANRRVSGVQPVKGSG